MADSNADQKTFWSETAAGKWMCNQETLDACFQPVLDAVLNASDLQPGQAVLDIGCGAGTSCLQAADRVGTDGSVLGLDISAPFLDQARVRAEGKANLSFRLDDAQDADLPQAQFDRLISRFGVMFFADTTAAFANLRKAMRPGARMVMAAWGQPGQNPWFTVPHHVAAARLGQPPKSDRYAPGPFAFHDTERTLALLRAAGLEASVEVCKLTLAETTELEALSHLMTETGPANNIVALFGGGPDDIAAIEAEVLEKYRAMGPGVPAEINLYTAICPDVQT